jgi:hypothetical protein
MEVTDLTGVGQVTCLSCNEEFKKIGQHWSQGSCNEPELTNEQHEILLGLLLGDGNVTRVGNSKPHYQLRMTNKKFLTWVHDKLGVFSTGVFRTYDEERDNWNKKKMYGVRTRSLEQLEEFADWYVSRTKTFPESKHLSPLEAKMWYVSDGCLKDLNGGQITIANCVQAEQKETMEKMFSNGRFDVSYSSGEIRISTTQTKEFLEWIGDPVPGFEYKWEVN